MNSKLYADEEFTIEDLPLELLFKIVDLLDGDDKLTLTRVSQKFRIISKDARFWKSFCVDVAHSTLDTGLLTLLSEHAHPHLKDLSFRSGRRVDPVKQLKSLQVIRFFGNCELLEILDLGDLTPNAEMTKFISTSFRHLKELIMDHELASNPAGLIHLTKLESLQKLHVKINYIFESDSNAQGLKIISENFKKLRELSLHVLLMYEPDIAEFIRVLDSHKDKLKCLSFDSHQSVDAVFKKVGECKYVEELCLDSEDMSDSCLANLHKLEHLRKLEFDHLPHATSGAYIKFFNESASLQTIESLAFTQINMCDVGFDWMTKNCPNLRRLYLCYGIGDQGTRLAEGCVGSIVENCTNLEYLDMIDMTVPLDRLVDVPEKLPKLRRLRVINHPMIPNPGLDIVRRLKDFAPAHLEVITEFNNDVKESDKSEESSSDESD